MSLHPSIGDLARHRSLSHLFDETEGGGRALPVGNVLRLDLDQRHPRVLRPSRMNSVAQVSEPSIGALAVTLLDPRIIVARGDNLASDADPVLCAAVLEGDTCCLVILDILELLGVVVRKEEAMEIWKSALLYIKTSR